MRGFFASALLVALAAGHGNMISPRPRQAHGQSLDSRNKCDCKFSPGGCYSNATSPGSYCGAGCIGEACLYYQIGCFQSCPVCSYTGKTLYPVPSDLVAAGNCPTPPEPTLGGGDAEEEHKLRTYNIDNLSQLKDWTRWNPWRSPGTAGLGNSQFQPCGVNSGSKPPFPDPPAAGQPQFANGTDLPPTARAERSVWKVGSVQEVSWAIYANHGGGYAYRLCRIEDGKEVTEDCFQNNHLQFATNTTEIRYLDGSKDPVTIPATTTNRGTYPAGSEWRKNPIPMCNCDIGEGCKGPKEDEPAQPLSKHAVEKSFHEHMKGVEATKCKQVIQEQCGTDIGVNTCLKCGDASDYDCEKCCPGLSPITKGEYKYCVPNKPTGECTPDNTRPCFTIPYNVTYLRPGQVAKNCPTGLMFPSSFDDGYGQGGDGRFQFEMVDKVKVPMSLPPGDYSLSWRWDCEQTPQVWNSCADVTVVRH